MKLSPEELKKERAFDRAPLPPVDGAGLQPHEHATAIAELLNLQPAQAAALVAELRNALVPARHWAQYSDPRAAAGITRVLLLADAIDVRIKK